MNTYYYLNSGDISYVQYIETALFYFMGGFGQNYGFLCSGNVLEKQQHYSNFRPL